MKLPEFILRFLSPRRTTQVTPSELDLAYSDLLRQKYGISYPFAEDEPK